MNLRAIAIAMLAAGGVASAAHGGTVSVCLENVTNDPAIEQAQLVADRILRTASVHPDWRTSGGACSAAGGRAIRVALLANAPGNADPLALARSFPYEGVHIEIYLDRIRNAQGALPYVLLAHVLAHEIAHILEGIVRHSETGVMKAHWTRADFERMQRLPLEFTPEDIELIREGMAERVARR